MIRLLRASAPLLAIAICVALTALALAVLPPREPDETQATFIQRLKLIAQVLYERVLLPRPPENEYGYRNWILTLQHATPILLTGLAVTLAFRANVLNIGAQGQMVLGAIAATAVGVYWNTLPTISIPALLLASMAGGALFASIAALLNQWRQVPVVLSTLLLNFVALEFLRYLLQGPMRARSEAGTLLDPQSPELIPAARLPEFFARNPGQGLHIGFVIAVAAALALAFLLRQTTFGFRLRVVGQNDQAARFAGMNVPRIATATLALSGALAGLAGGIQVAGLTPHVLHPDMATNALGFTGIAVALLARLSPLGVMLSAIFFGLLNTAFRAFEREMGIGAVTAQAVQGALIIAMLVLTRVIRSKRSAEF